MTAVSHGPVVIRRRLGHVLKQLRGGRKLQLADVARKLEISPSKLSRIETGHVEPKFRDVRDLLEIYDAPVDLRDRVLDWASEAKSPGWWQPLAPSMTIADLDMLISLETESRTKVGYSLAVPGLLQTAQYARALLMAGLPTQPAHERDRLVEIRMRRQAVLDPDRPGIPPLELHQVIDESALYRSDDPALMGPQLRRLLEWSEQPNITIQVLQFRAGWTPAMGNFSIFEPRDPVTDWPVVNVESSSTDAYTDSGADVAHYRSTWEATVERAMSPQRSRELIARMVH